VNGTPEERALARSSEPLLEFAARPIERRSRQSGQVSAKACPRCGTPVPIDPRRIQMLRGRGVLACDACGGRVPVRHADLYRPDPPADIVTLRPRQP
jgi:hypothetical protein